MRLVLLMFCVFSVSAAEELNYDQLLDQVAFECRADWNIYIDEMKEHGDDQALIDAEVAARDQYLLTLVAIKKSKDLTVKRQMIRYQYTYFVSIATSDLSYAETVADKIKATAKLAAQKKRLKDFEKHLQHVQSNNAEEVP